MRPGVVSASALQHSWRKPYVDPGCRGSEICQCGLLLRDVVAWLLRCGSVAHSVRYWAAGVFLDLLLREVVVLTHRYLTWDARWRCSRGIRKVRAAWACGCDGADRLVR